jgi:four helix bundle protein
MSEPPQDLKPRTKAFALRIIRMYAKLPKNEPVAQVLGKQVLRSGTPVGANYREATLDELPDLFRSMAAGNRAVKTFVRTSG